MPSVLEYKEFNCIGSNGAIEALLAQSIHVLNLQNCKTQSISEFFAKEHNTFFPGKYIDFSMLSQQDSEVASLVLELAATEIISSNLFTQAGVDWLQNDLKTFIQNLHPKKIITTKIPP
jgi:hypothetical protein